MKGLLLSSEDWHYLASMKSLQDVVRYLGGTPYAPSLAKLGTTTPDAGAVVLALYDTLFEDYGKLLRAVPTAAARLLKSLVARYEAENLKTLLRGVWQGRPPSEIRLLLYRLGPLSRLPVEALVALRQVTAAVDLLQSTPFHRALLHALPQFLAQGRLFPLEMAIDRATFEHIGASLERLTGFDRREAKAVIGEWIDGVNLAWLVRFRHFYGLSAEEAINYTLQGGRRLGIQDLGRLARAADLPALVQALPPPYREALSPAEHWGQFRTLFERRFIVELHRTFRKDPFQIGLPLCTLLLKEIEVKSLESLLSAVEMQLPGERLTEWISPPAKGGMRV
jgi:V/A-type H+/Na+-transporting ATPase subunit C